MSIFRRSHRIYPGPDETDSIFQENKIELVSDVIVTHSTYPTTGVYSEDEVKGWQWSKTFPQRLNNRRDRIETSIGGASYSLEEGSVLNNWQGAVLEGLELKKIEESFKKITSSWKPFYSTGEYSIYHRNKRMNSDYCLSKVLEEPSEIEPEPDPSGIDNANPEVVINNRIEGIIYNTSIAIYKRDSRFTNFPFYKYVFDPNLETPNSYYTDEEDPDESGTVHSLININELKKIKIGGNYDLIDDERAILNTWEYGGKGNQGRSIIYTEFFPVEKEGFQLVELVAGAEDDERDYHLWTRVPKFTYDGGRQYILDELKGIVKINSIEPNETAKIKSVSGIDGRDSFYEITFFEKNKKINSELGVLTINDNDYNYYDFNGKSLIIQISDPEIDVSGWTEVTFKQEGEDFSLGSDLYMSYTAIPRIDYEVSNKEELLLRSDETIDLKPYRSIENSGLIEINPYEKHISSIELSSTLTPGASLKMGVETLKLTAEVLNSAGGRVKEADVYFYCDFGFFNNGSKEYFTRSNKEGEAFSYYNWPYNERDSYLWVTGDGVTTIDGRSVLKIGISGTSSREIENVNVFQSLKIDPFYGFGGQKLTIESVEELENDQLRITFTTPIRDIEEYVGNQMMFLENETQFGNDLCTATNNHGYAFVKDISNRDVRCHILGIENNNTIIINKNYIAANLYRRPSGEMRLYKSKELQYSRNRRRETGLTFDRLLYIDEGNASLTPLRAEDWHTDADYLYIIYPARVTLPAASEYREENIVAGYKIFLNKKATIHAETLDPATGRTIQSNRLTIDVTLPDFLRTTEGFQLSGENIDGSGIGGSTFLKLEQVDGEIEDPGDSTQIILYNPFKNGFNIIIDNEV